MTTLLEPAAPSDLPASPTALPPIGQWWPMLERPLRREILERPEAPLRRAVVRRILDLCDLERAPLPRRPVRLGENERAYLAGWSRTVDWV